MSDAFRVDATIATLYNIVERGGRPILMAHVGRPYDETSAPSSPPTTSPSPPSSATSSTSSASSLPSPGSAPTTRAASSTSTRASTGSSRTSARVESALYLPNVRWFGGRGPRPWRRHRRAGRRPPAFRHGCGSGGRLRQRRLRLVAAAFLHVGRHEVSSLVAGLLMQKEARRFGLRRPKRSSPSSRGRNSTRRSIPFAPSRRARTTSCGRRLAQRVPRGEVRRRCAGGFRHAASRRRVHVPRWSPSSCRCRRSWRAPPSAVRVRREKARAANREMPSLVRCDRGAWPS